MEQNTSRGRPIFLNVERFPALLDGAPIETAAVVMELIAVYAPEGHGAFAFDPERCARAIRAGLPKASRSRREMTTSLLARLRPYLLRFFVELPDGRWALSPDVFSAVDGNPGTAS